MEVQSLLNFDLDPGPVDQSILVWQHEHRSAAIWEDEVCTKVCHLSWFLFCFRCLTIFVILSGSSP